MYPVRKMVAGGVLAAAALTGGALGATLFGTANAATNASDSNSSATGTSSTAPHTPNWSKGGHQANGKTETVLTGDAKAKAIAAAKAAVPGATAQRAESDAEGATYEVHMTKTDGSIVTVKLDANFTVTGTINGMG
ncbi:MAG: hypothetical protein ABJA34_10070 [Pseudonocardiales bacterium]